MRLAVTKHMDSALLNLNFGERGFSPHSVSDETLVKVCDGLGSSIGHVTMNTNNLILRRRKDDEIFRIEETSEMKT